MSKLPRLRRLLWGLALGSLPLLAGCPMCPDQETFDKQVWLQPDGGALSALIDPCRADATACEPLCRHVVAELDGHHDIGLDVCELGEQDGELLLRVTYWDAGVACGRRPAGLDRCPPPPARDAVAAWLARAAHLEAASIDAFHRLAGELRTHGAPRVLVAAARRAAADEVRHAARVGRLARRRGAVPPPVHAAPPRRRSLAALAAENAGEGCVRETYGALVAMQQSRAATDPAVRALLAGIAGDEARHAELAHAIDAWAAPRLPARARTRVAAARRRAVDELRAAARVPVPSALAARLGLPSPAQARRLIDDAAAALRW